MRVQASHPLPCELAGDTWALTVFPLVDFGNALLLLAPFLVALEWEKHVAEQQVFC